jgi:hypothetical protein
MKIGPEITYVIWATCSVCAVYLATDWLVEMVKNKARLRRAERVARRTFNNLPNSDLLNNQKEMDLPEFLGGSKER